MTQWFYVDSGEQRGPVSQQELLRLIETNRIPAGTQVWSEGLAEWTEASSLSEFTPSPYAPPQTGINTAVAWDDYTPSGPQARPWVRYWARSGDMMLFVIGISFVVGMVKPELMEMNDTLFGLLALVGYNFVEPAMLSIWGATPMKWILKVRVRNKEGSKLTYTEALGRTFKVWLKGEGLGIPLISLITHITAYNTLNNHGITSWDREGPFTVSHQTIEWWRWIAMLLILIGIISLMVLGQEIT